MAAQQTEVARLLRDDNLKLPLNLDYDSMTGLSIVEKDALKKTRPESMAQARRMEGMTPSGCVKLLAHVRRADRGPKLNAAATAEIGLGVGADEQAAPLISRG